MTKPNLESEIGFHPLDNSAETEYSCQIAQDFKDAWRQGKRALKITGIIAGMAFTAAASGYCIYQYFNNSFQQFP